MCAGKTRESFKKLKDGALVCPRCFRHSQGRKTMTFHELQRLCMCNSSKVPVVEIGGLRRKWVGIGLIEDGPAEGNEVLITP